MKPFIAVNNIDPVTLRSNIQIDQVLIIEEDLGNIMTKEIENILKTADQKGAMKRRDKDQVGDGKQEAEEMIEVNQGHRDEGLLAECPVIERPEILQISR